MFSRKDHPVPAPLQLNPPVEDKIKEIDEALKLNYNQMTECLAAHDDEKAQKARVRMNELLDRRLVLMGQRDSVLGIF